MPNPSGSIQPRTTARVSDLTTFTVAIGVQQPHRHEPVHSHLPGHLRQSRAPRAHSHHNHHLLVGGPGEACGCSWRGRGARRPGCCLYQPGSQPRPAHATARPSHSGYVRHCGAARHHPRRIAVGVLLALALPPACCLVNDGGTAPTARSQRRHNATPAQAGPSSSALRGSPKVIAKSDADLPASRIAIFTELYLTNGQVWLASL